MPTSVRLDDITEAILRRLAEQTGQTKSAIIRKAIERYHQDLYGDEDKSPTLYDRISDLVGVGEDGRSDLGRRSEKILRERFTGGSDTR